MIKIGSSTLMDEAGQLDTAVTAALVARLAHLHQEGREILMVTSGAVGLGARRLSMEKPLSIPQKQAAAAVGQGLIMGLYEQLFSVWRIPIAQILLSRDDLSDRSRYLNAKNTLNVLLEQGVIPIINENDTVAYEELRFGENDTLAAMSAGLVDADLLVLLSDIDGLYDADPRRDATAKLIPLVEEIGAEIEAAAGGVGSVLGSGGMKSKIDAARIAGQAGIPLAILYGKKEENLAALLAGESVGTLFVPKGHKLRHRQRWIAYGSQQRGVLTVDAGAARAITERGGSLLPVGVLRVEGDFEQGAVVRIEAEDGRELARGISNYAAADVRRLCGLHTAELAAALGIETLDFEEIVHRNNMVAAE